MKKRYKKDQNENSESRNSTSKNRNINTNISKNKKGLFDLYDISDGCKANLLKKYMSNQYSPKRKVKEGLIYHG